MQCGYCNSWNGFANASTSDIIKELETFVPDAGESQIRAWRDSIKLLQRNVSALTDQHPQLLSEAFVILEYHVPLESRRIDSLLLVRGCAMVIEFKGKPSATQADIDQATAYARDLRAYHRECSSLKTTCFLIPTRYLGAPYTSGETCVIGPNDLPSKVIQCIEAAAPVPNLSRFLAADSYQPLPSLIKAARELFNSGTLRRIHRAAMATEPTLDACSLIVHQTAIRKRRALILICGVPGAGKTLVGLQLAHAKFLDDLAVARASGEKPTSPAVFLSGNGPLVEVLQYEMRSAGGDGKAFVRGVHDYVKSYTRRADSIPPQHVLIYDEAQRAFDAEQVATKHPDLPAAFQGLSEPELFVQFAERVPEWCVVVGLIGSGQEIHIGEEAGLAQWRSAIEKTTDPDAWDIYIPTAPGVQSDFDGFPRLAANGALELKQTIRFHLATCLYDFVENLLAGNQQAALNYSLELEAHGYTLRITHDLDRAKSYLSDRYSDNPDARYGMLASSKDKDLVKFGIPKGFKSPGEVGPGKYGRWYSDPANSDVSCTSLSAVATEFGAQGLELDGCLLAWGTDLVRVDEVWSNRYASGYRDAHRVRDAMALRVNAYRVLLTRGRDGCVVFIPPIPDKMRQTYKYLCDCGFTTLSDSSVQSAALDSHFSNECRTPPGT
jgi:hypothetical protein